MSRGRDGLGPKCPVTLITVGIMDILHWGQRNFGHTSLYNYTKQC